jgi:hypothetical protein
MYESSVKRLKNAYARCEKAKMPFGIVTIESSLIRLPKQLSFSSSRKLPDRDPARRNRLKRAYKGW